ncbi:MAG: formate--tetrahydrofolate ligase [Phycisphaerales bacterium]|nr:formate--tetrahydrofolate ligase [Phycisphaerales bacterium]
MPILSDIEIAHQSSLKHIRDIANKLGIAEDDLELYGKHKAKLPLQFINADQYKNKKLILVTAITPTPAGEGKTTLSIGLGDGLSKLGKKTAIVLREPSLGPVFAMKGGATGGGYSQVLPMDDINLHFNGDFSAVEKANNLLAAAIDNELYHGTKHLNLDARTITWKRVLDVNDRSLRHTIIGLGGKTHGIPRESGFNITAASEVMAILCLSKNFNDLHERLEDILVGYSFDKKPVFVKDLKVANAMVVLLKDALKPNIVQTIEGTPALIHGGPFANIAQGTNSIVATTMALSLADYVVTEAGFGADLGAEKFINIKCPVAEIEPVAIVLVLTIRALRYHGGAHSASINEPCLDKVKMGFANVHKHIDNCKKYGFYPIVAINYFLTDTEDEIKWVQEACHQLDIRAVLSKGWSMGAAGCVDLAQAVLHSIDHGKNQYRQLYDWNLPIKDKIFKIATEIYGANDVIYSKKASEQLEALNKLKNASTFPICMAKTQKSFSDDEQKLGAPTNFSISVREFEVAMGAKFIIPIIGDIMRMPGLPAHPLLENMGINKEGDIYGLS